MISLNSKKRATGRDKKGKSAYKPVVPAVEQASRILLFFEESPHFKVILTEIGQQVAIHKSKAFSILKTLKQFGFVETYGPKVVNAAKQISIKLGANTGHFYPV